MIELSERELRRPEDRSRGRSRAIAGGVNGPDGRRQGMVWGGRPRVIGVDATWGVALLGMIAVQSLYETDPDRPTWSYAILGGLAAATFAVLAGVGIAFMTGRRRVGRAMAAQTMAVLGVTAVGIGLVGLALGTIDEAAVRVILPYYAVIFALAIPLVFLPTWTVAAIGAAVATGMPVLGHVLLPRLPEPTLDNPTFGYLLHHPVELLAELTITGEYPALPWLAYACAGLVVGRLDLTRVRVAAALLASGTALAVGASLAAVLLLSRYGGLEAIWLTQPGSELTVLETQQLLTIGGDGTTPADTWWWLAVDRPRTGTPPDLIGTAGTVLALLGMLLLAAQVTLPVARGLIAAVLAPLAAAGSMTLTFYTLHILFINSDHNEFDPALGYLLQFVGVLLVGLGWRATAGRGPMEALLAALANRARRFPRRRSPPDPVERRF